MENIPEQYKAHFENEERVDSDEQLAAIEEELESYDDTDRDN
jgi:hypothetical protein